MSVICASGSLIGKQKKHCYVDIEISGRCPDCGVVIKTDFSAYYLNYPEKGSITEVSVHCPYCDEYYTAEVLVKDISMELEYSNIFKKMNK